MTGSLTYQQTGAPARDHVHILFAQTMGYVAGVGLHLPVPARSGSRPHHPGCCNPRVSRQATTRLTRIRPLPCCSVPRSAGDHGAAEPIAARTRQTPAASPIGQLALYDHDMRVQNRPPEPTDLCVLADVTIAAEVRAHSADSLRQQLHTYRGRNDQATRRDHQPPRAARPPARPRPHRGNHRPDRKRPGHVHDAARKATGVPATQKSHHRRSDVSWS